MSTMVVSSVKLLHRKAREYQQSEVFWTVESSIGGLDIDILLQEWILRRGVYLHKEDFSCSFLFVAFFLIALSAVR